MLCDCFFLGGEFEKKRKNPVIHLVNRLKIDQRNNEKNPLHPDYTSVRISPYTDNFNLDLTVKHMRCRQKCGEKLISAKKNVQQKNFKL